MTEPTSITSLAVYGSLAPGEVNAHVLQSLRGTWRRGVVRGRLVPAGWGAGIGFPALVPDLSGPAVPVSVLTSPELPAHLARLDAFEGDEYQRVVVPVEVDGGVEEAWIYAMREGAIPDIDVRKQ